MKKEDISILDKIANELYTTRHEYKDLNEFDQAIWDNINLYFDFETNKSNLLSDLNIFPFSQEKKDCYYDEIVERDQIKLSLPSFDYISKVIYEQGFKEFGIDSLDDLF